MFTSQYCSVVQLKGKHCRRPNCRNGVVDTFEHCPYDYDKKNKIQIQSFSRTLPFRSVWKEHKIMSNMTSHNAVSWNKREKLHTQCTKRFFFSILKETFLVFVINCCMVPLIFFFFFFFATMLFMYLYFKTVCFCICYKEVKKKGFWQKDIHTALHFLYWISVVVPFNTWLILSCEENKCCYKLSKCTKWHIFHSNGWSCQF